MYKKKESIRVGVFAFLAIFIAMTIVNNFTGLGVFTISPPVGWSGYVRNLPRIIIGSLIFGIVIARLYSVWSKHYDEEDKKKWEEVRKRLTEKEKTNIAREQDDENNLG